MKDMEHGQSLTLIININKIQTNYYIIFTIIKP